MLTVYRMLISNISYPVLQFFLKDTHLEMTNGEGYTALNSESMNQTELFISH